MDNRDPFVEKHLNRIKIIQALNGSKRLFVECMPTDNDARTFPNSNFAIKEIFIEDISEASSGLTPDQLTRLATYFMNHGQAQGEDQTIEETIKWIRRIAEGEGGE